MESSEKRFSEQSTIEAIEKNQSFISADYYLSDKDLTKICAVQNINLIDGKSEPHLIQEMLETAVTANGNN